MVLGSEVSLIDFLCQLLIVRTCQRSKVITCLTSPLLCAECMCYPMGTAPQACSSPDDCQCDQLSGQCPCQPNVVGQNCDRCAADTWNIASGTGCQRCDCDPDHSYGSSCNEVSQTPR